ncbi:MAG TPA: glycosyltransferase family 39 protein [Planctomycetota bacterium]|nr:glycosyltransferase family 39 protein [Planctomycetota bacterium]
MPLALGAAILATGIAAPWTGSYDANGALYSIAARNYLRHGLIATRGGQVCNAGLLRPQDFRFYSHHPPGISLSLAASFAVFGEHEWSGRLVPLLFTLGAAALLYFMARELGGPLAGSFAALVFVVQPMVGLYGRMPDHEAPGAFFALLLTWMYLQWQRTGRRGWPLAMAGATFLGVWFAWVVFIVPWLLLGHGWLVRRRDLRPMLIPAAGALLGLASVLGHIALVEGGLGGLGQALVHRFGAQALDRDVSGSFTLAQFVERQGVYFWTGFSVLAACLSLAWAWRVGRRKRDAALLAAALAAFALANVLGPRQGAYVHIYYQFYLALPLALTAGLALGALPRRRAWQAAAFALAALVAAEGMTKLVPVWRAQRWDGFLGSYHFYPYQLRMADYLRRHTEPGDRILLLCDLPYSFRQLTYYSDRNIRVVADEEEAKRLWGEDGYTKAFALRHISGYAIMPLFTTGSPPMLEYVGGPGQ